MPDTMTLGMSIQVDAAQAKAVMDSLGVSTDQLAAKVSSGGRQMTEGIGTSREAARLFGEEFGLKLPRGISSSIARMQEFQAISSSVFQVAAGAFAVERVISMGKAVKDLVDDMNEVKRS